jgi:curved DNA-binding protein CbpA
MNYYEEFGVSPSASTEEIRHSYKALARLLHPDQICDASLKGVAELQMRRLNEILSVLTDPNERRRYDLSLAPPAPPQARRPREAIVVPRPPEPSRLRALAIGLCAWLPPAAGVVIFIAAVSYYGGGRPDEAALFRTGQAEVGTRATAASPAKPPSVTEDAAPLPSARLDRQGTLGEFMATRRRLEALRAEAEQTPATSAPAAGLASAEDAPSELPSARPVMEAKTLPVVSHLETGPLDRAESAPANLAGNWYYLPARHQAAAKGIYLPEYVELRLAENAGIVTGKYRGRYHITDLAISPEVVFRFEGSTALPSAQFNWTSAGGAEGQVTLHLLSPDQLEVTWTASKLSADVNLAAGLVRLVRQREHQ